MAKRLKLKLSRVIPSLQFCRSKRSSAFAETPSPAIYRLSPFNPKAFDIGYPNFPAPPPSTPENRFIKRNLSSKVISVGCCCRSGSCTQNNIPSSEYCGVKSPGYSWKKEAARWYVAPKARETKGHRKIYDASSDDDGSPAWVRQNRKTRRDKMDKKRVVSVSSRDSGCFSSDGDEKTETLVSSSRSFSDDSSSEIDRSMERTGDSIFNGENKLKKKKVNTNIKKIRRLRRQASMNYKESNKTVASPGKESEVRTSGLKRMTIPCTVEGKVRESVAVVKKSADPYDDFKQSMWEMILEKQMFEAKDLEQLLQCFLSLNSNHYHGIIVQAFSEIWEVLFCDFPAKGARTAVQFKA